MTGPRKDAAFEAGTGRTKMSTQRGPHGPSYFLLLTPIDPPQDFFLEGQHIWPAADTTAAAHPSCSDIHRSCVGREMALQVP